MTERLRRLRDKKVSFSQVIYKKWGDDFPTTVEVPTSTVHRVVPPQADLISVTFIGYQKPEGEA